MKRAREARGVALDAVASATRIARRYLDALERSDLQALPA
ncbi:MAG: helix-turn-helix domain-containing protein, partial [Vicinamibacteria bacterium]